MELAIYLENSPIHILGHSMVNNKPNILLIDAHTKRNLQKKVRTQTTSKRKTAADSRDNNLRLATLPLILCPLLVGLGHPGMIMLRPQPKLIPQRLRDLLTMSPRETIYDARLIRVPRFDKGSDLLEDCVLFLFADVVVQVGPVEGLFEEDAVGDTEFLYYIFDDRFVGCGGESHDGYVWVPRTKTIELGIL